MADGWPQLIVSDLIGVPHGFLTGPQSDRGELDLVGGLMPTVWLRQVHSARALVVSDAFAPEAMPEADAMVTDRPGLRLAIRTADCAPVLLADAAAGVVGAAHAGWRGALGGPAGGVLENTVAAMVQLGAQPARIAAAIGPCIAQASYEVDEGFRARFAAADERFFAPGREGRYQFDLEAYAAWRLAQAGVGRVDCLGIDTYANEARFHSHRRATHREVADEGRQFSLIALAA